MSDIILICFYFCAIVIFSLKQAVNISDIRVFSLGNRKYSTRVMVTALTSTWVTGEAIFGSTISIFENGLIAYLMLLSVPISMLLTSEFLTCRIANFYDCISIGDIVEKSFGKNLKIFVGFFSFIKTLIVLASQLSVIGYIFYYLLGVSFNYGVIIGSFVIFICSFFGGAKSITMTGIIQFGIFIVSVPTICNVSLLHVDGYFNLFQSLPEHLTNIKFFDERFLNFSLGFCMLLIPACSPYAIQKLLMTQNSEQAVSSLRYSALVAFIFYLLIMLTSLSAILLQPSLDPNLVLPYLINELLPSSIKIIAVSGLFSAVLSSAQTMLNTASVSIAHDICQAVRNGKIEQRREVNIARSAGFVVIVSGAVLTINCSDIFSILTSAGQIWVSVIFFPFILALYKVNISKECVYINILTSFMIIIFWKIFALKKLYYFDYGLCCLLYNGLFVLIYLNFKKIKYYFSSDKLVRNSP